MTTKRVQIANAIATDDGQTVLEITRRPFLYGKRAPKWLRNRPIESNCPEVGELQIGANWCKLVQIERSFAHFRAQMVIRTCHE